MKCEICGRKIEILTMGKIKGTYLKDEHGKLHVICSECQKRFKTKDEILKNIK